MSNVRTRRTKRHNLVVKCASEYANFGGAILEPNLLDVHKFLTDSASENTKELYASEYTTEVTEWASRQRYFLYHVVMCVDAINASNKIRQGSANSIESFRVLFEEQLRNVHNAVLSGEVESDPESDGDNLDEFAFFVEAHQAHFAQTLVNRLSIRLEDAFTVVSAWTISFFV